MKIKLERNLERNDNELKKVQKILLNQMNRLDDEKTMEHNSKREIMRSGAISQSACAYVKSVQTQIKILDLSSKYSSNVADVNKFLGIDVND